MADQPLSELPVELVSFLQGNRLVLLVTDDADSGHPNVHAVSWVVASDSKTVRLAADTRARLVRNLQASDRAVLVVPGAGGFWSINCRAEMESAILEDVPLKLARLRLDVEVVRDVMFFGSRLTEPPAYEVTYNPDAAARLDNRVFTALRR